MPNTCCEHCEVVNSDHDLLITIDTKLSNLIAMNGNHYEDHENRIRRIERWGFTALGALFIIQIAVGYVISLIK